MSEAWANESVHTCGKKPENRADTDSPPNRMARPGEGCTGEEPELEHDHDEDHDHSDESESDTSSASDCRASTYLGVAVASVVGLAASQTLI